MKQVTMTVPTTIVMRVPNSWGVRRAAKHISGATIVSRDGTARFRRSQVQTVTVGPVTKTDVAMMEEAGALPVGG